MGFQISRNRALLPLYISVFVAVLGFSLVAPIFPRYVTEMGASYTMLGIIVSIYGAVQLITQVPIGRLSDRIGRKGLMIAGLLTFTLMPPLYIYATNVYVLIPIRIFGGIGASAVWPLAMALVIDQAGQGERGAAMGWYNAAFYSALALGPAIGGLLYDLFGLHAPFLFWAALGAASVVMVAVTVREPPRRTPVDLLTPARPKENLVLPGYLMTFVACCGAVMWVGIIGGFNFTMLPAYAGRLDLTTTQIGLLYMDYAGATALSNIYFGRAADRGRRKALLLAGCLAGAVSFGLLYVASSLPQVLILLGLLGIGLGIGSPAAAALIADTTCLSRRGEVFGVFNTARMSGVVVGPLVAGLTADAYGVDGAIVAFTAIALIMAALTFAVRDPRTEPACIDGVPK